MKKHLIVLSWLLLCLTQVLLAEEVPQEKPDGEVEPDAEDHKKEGRAFSIFNVVQFKNIGCRSTSALASGQSPYRNGTCYTSSECSSKGGTASGNCASGFGVCCLFIYTSSGSTISQNCSYIRNPGFPSAYSASTAVTYNINKCIPGVCYLRLDFESFTILGPTVSTETLGGSCPDTFKVTTSTGQAIPTICGWNTGQHIYVDIGSLSTDTATLAFTFSGTSTTRAWEIKVSQIECYNPNRPPEGCLQYFTTYTGRITTFNFLQTTSSSNLASQDYGVCIKNQAGYCCVQYTVCQNVPNAFTLDSGVTTSGTDTSCSMDFISIPGSSNICGSSTYGDLASRYCGTYLNIAKAAVINQHICNCNSPFTVWVHTDAITDIAAQANTVNTAYSRGDCLDYNLVPCNTRVN